jgi:hypothetical protein
MYVDVESITPTALAISLYSDIVGYCTQRSNAFSLIRMHQFMSLSTVATLALTIRARL